MLAMDKKVYIKNRQSERIAVVVRIHDTARGCAVVQHGLAGSKDEKHIAAAARVFFDAVYTTVLFDATNTYGESDGTIEQSTMTKHYEDLEDVIAWMRTEPWCHGKLVLAGHSMGGYAVTRFAEIYPNDVAAVFPLSPVVSGALTLAAHELYEPGYIQHWKETGWREDRSISNPERVRRLPWSHMEDRLTHDLLPDALKLTMPVHIIVGDTDRISTVDHMRTLFDALPGVKSLHIIPNCAHVYRTDAQIELMSEAIQRELKGL